MSLTLHEQIARKCIHFNGVMEKTCKAGINYSDVRFDKPYKFPCLQQGGECRHAKFLNANEVNEKVREIEEEGFKVMAAAALIKDHYSKTKEMAGKITCVCGGELHYAIASINGHAWGRCKSCGISFNE